MSNVSDIKVITQAELEGVEWPKRRSRAGKRRRGRKSEPVTQLVEVLRTRAHSIDDVADEHVADSPLIVLIDAGVGMTALEVLVLMRGIGGDRTRFSKLVEALMPTEEIPPAPEVEQARRNASARSRFLREFPAASSAEVAELYGSTARNRAALAQSWRKQGRVFAIPVGNTHRFPLFQLGESGEPKPVIAEVLPQLSAAGIDGWQVALWFAGALASLGNNRPVDLIDEDPERVVQAAAHAGDVPQ